MEFGFNSRAAPVTRRDKCMINSLSVEVIASLDSPGRFLLPTSGQPYPSYRDQFIVYGNCQP